MKIDNEFRALIPPLGADEYAQLEANIIADGCRDPLVVWGGTLIDGHNRHKICTEHGIPYATKEHVFADRDAAIIWIIENQFGRRNLTPFTRAELSLRMEDAIARRAKANMKAGGGDKRAGLAMLPNPMPPTHTRAEVAKAAGIGERSIDKVKHIKAAEQAGHVDAKTIAALRDGKATINEVYNTAKREIRKQEETDNRQKAVASLAVEFDYGGVLQVRSVDKITLPDESVDMVFTDPPYHDEYVGLYDKLGGVAKRVLRPGGYCMAYVGKMFLPEVIAALSRHLEYVWVMCVWQPDNNSKIARHNLFEAWRPILVFRKPGKSARREWVPDAVNSVRSKGFHPWQQSEQAPESYIGAYTSPGDTVLDPFCGGGTTAAVCRNIGRKFITYDISEEAIETAMWRLQRVQS